MNNNYGVESKPAELGEAIETGLKKYFVFDGRASKSEFWYFLLFHVGVSFVTSFIHPAVNAIFILGTLIPMISVGCRRLHDINKSGWWQLIPIYNLILWVGDSVSGPTQANRSGSLRNDLTDELEELQELYKEGTLSEAQFKKAKNKLLK
tara:strand:- start:102 stop:551 length:450 start_codon:yes stop_codon:yes gene_type:complete